MATSAPCKDVRGVFMKNWTVESCGWEEAYKKAEQCAASVGMALDMANLESEYWDGVFGSLVEAATTGEGSPNADCLCNRRIKFGALRRHLGEGSWIATGHYARTNAEGHLLRGHDVEKDQSYFLCLVPSFRGVIFPIGNMKKRPDVVDLARRLKLPHLERESMGLCFVEQHSRFRTFMKEFVRTKHGDVVEYYSGKTVGVHEGVGLYTIGERVRMGGADRRWYVTKKDPKRNLLYVVDCRTDPSLYSNAFSVTWLNWIDDKPPPFEQSLLLQHRYRTRAVKAWVVKHHGAGVDVQLEERLWGVTSGQVCAFYDASNERCYGGGITVAGDMV